MKKNIGVAVNAKIEFTTYKQCIPIHKKKLMTTQQRHEFDGTNPEESY